LPRRRQASDDAGPEDCVGIEFAWLIGYVERVHERTYEAAAIIDDEMVGWRPRTGEWTFGEAVTHIANSRLMNLGTIAGRGARYAGHEPPPRATAQVLRRQLEDSSKRTLEGLRAIDLGAEVRTIRGQGVPAFQIVVSGLIEHEVHHRSQLCDYLAAAGLAPPPLYGLHEEDLPR
jgi:uncharacterized damage-inducible protein DinB